MKTQNDSSNKIRSNVRENLKKNQGKGSSRPPGSKKLNDQSEAAASKQQPQKYGTKNNDFKSIATKEKGNRVKDADISSDRSNKYAENKTKNESKKSHRVDEKSGTRAKVDYSKGISDISTASRGKNEIETGRADQMNIEITEANLNSFSEVDYNDDFEEESESSPETSDESSSDEQSHRQMSDFITGRTKENEEKVIEHRHETLKSILVERTETINTSSKIRSGSDMNEHNSNDHAPINFELALKKHRSDSLRKSENRSALLLSLLDLQEQKFNVLEIKPSTMNPIDARYHAVKTTQTQDNYLEEETQTDRILATSKWTQHPISFDITVCRNSDGDIVKAPGRSDFQGYGGDETDQHPQQEETPIIANTRRFNKIIVNAGKCFLKLLDESDHKDSNHRQFSETSAMPGFSESAINLNVSGVQQVQQCKITHLSFNTFDSNILASIHEPASDDTGAGYVCVWSLDCVSAPLYTLILHTVAQCCCFLTAGARMVAVGCRDGSVSVCSLTEDQPAAHNTQQRYIRRPSYTATQSAGTAHHLSEIVSIRAPPALDNKHSVRKLRFCSLDRSGGLLYWHAKVANKEDRLHTLDTDLGRSPWSQIRVICVAKVDVRDFADHHKLMDSTGLLQANDFCFHPVSGDDPVLVAIDSGSVVACSKRTNGRSYQSLKTARKSAGWASAFISVDCCPFGDNLMVCGGDDGVLRLFAVRQYGEMREGVLHWPPTGDWLGDRRRSVRFIRWSRTRPSVVFTLAGANTIQVWDLAANGDLMPAVTVEPADGPSISAIDVSSRPSTPSHCGSGTESTLVAFSNSPYSIQVHRVIDTYSKLSDEQFEIEMNNFLHYIN